MQPGIIIPHDPLRCQAEKPNGHSFMTLGGRPGRERCAAVPTVIATEAEVGSDGRRGSMSLCTDCLVVFLRQMPQGFATISNIKEG